jgi:hypothetical protein
MVSSKANLKNPDKISQVDSILHGDGLYFGFAENISLTASSKFIEANS